MTSKQFSAGTRECVKTCSFFPKVSDVLKAVQSYRENPPQVEYGHLQLSDSTSHHDLTPEEIERNLARFDAIKRMLAGELSMERALEAVEKANDIKTFGDGSNDQAQHASN